jgi:ribosomal protein L37AE/L43A
MICPNCKQRIRRNANRRKKNRIWYHKRCPKQKKEGESNGGEDRNA